MVEDIDFMSHAELWAEHDRLTDELLLDPTNEELESRVTAIFMLIMRMEDR